MGANFETYRVRAVSAQKLRDDVIPALIRECQHESGHGGYTGTIAESNGQVDIPDLPIMSYEDAENYISEHAQKWEASIAIRLDGPGLFWLIGGWYSC